MCVMSVVEAAAEVTEEVEAATTKAAEVEVTVAAVDVIDSIDTYYFLPCIGYI